VRWRHTNRHCGECGGAAVRELWEETGLVATRLAYAGSHPWSFSGPSVLLTDFQATVTDPALRPDPGEIARRGGSAGRTFASWHRPSCRPSRTRCRWSAGFWKPAPE
jgi:hypothetical protein